MNRTTQVVGEVMYGGTGVDNKVRATQVVGEVMFRPTPQVEVWAEKVLVVSSLRTGGAVINNPSMM